MENIDSTGVHDDVHDGDRDVPGSTPSSAQTLEAAQSLEASQSLEAGPTGDQVVDEALEGLDDLADRPLREHVTAFESVHGALQDRLAEGQR